MKSLIIVAFTASSAAAQVIVGTNSFDVVFEETNLTTVAQSRIIDDINLCRQLWANSEVYIYDDEEDGELFIGDGYVIGKPYFNDMRVPRGLVTNSAGALSLLVSKPVSDAYLKAFEFADANSNLISAANAFVDALSNSNTICNTISELREYILFPENIAVDPQEQIEGFKSYKYSKPSVMAFGYFNQGPEPSIGVSSNLFMKLQYSLDKTISIYQLPCIWHGGKWKLYFWNFNEQY